MCKKPIIGVCLPNKGNKLAEIFIRFSLFLANAKAVSLRPDEHSSKDKIDGLILSGGSDINPLLYGGKKEAHNTKLDKKRDAFELDMIKTAVQKRIPIFGICRGAQLLNIFFDGDLYPTVLDIEEYLIHKNSIFPIKDIFIKKKSKLFDIVKKEKLKANSLHNQAIHKVGEDLKVTAKYKGLIQAIEKKNYPFMLAVQWHPEYLFYIKEHRKIFKDFVKACLN
ncbi:gamma-glutamyl-gamma-aminobutyrate hydrolase [Malaciobacter molluscorum LMG 25693]|uniref:Gamma-glutamyl hydrolase, peptidase C26 family n=1 Tax=Malaciobacter molluscorum LMG 25693 TaxID=870501 RepID=A0A2G1DKH8_9BACT|nr:gamma-glutamyl-gamma-aminobutyrate hydrolase family protein [Malaciobacter molluscorum]AXX92583.1 gamma-glutamyl hydrolase, peptidase C26 family [Malaciobacter molluscorum LMG 25693]PHO19007.1 gamma-glutamyl-gamma-aminobutyrate hydrolase [Malaciobacter molluscorum LMG 25693]